jgi:hypothetical protein
MRPALHQVASKQQASKATAEPAMSRLKKRSSLIAMAVCSALLTSMDSAVLLVKNESPLLARWRAYKVESS